MEIEEEIPEYKLNLHKAKKGYVAELFLKERENQSKLNDIELILIVDRSGSMGQYYPKIFQKVMPLLLDKINYPQNKKVHFITFESYIASSLYVSVSNDFENVNEGLTLFSPTTLFSTVK